MLSILNIFKGKKAEGDEEASRAVASSAAGAMLRAGTQEVEESYRLPSLGENETVDMSKLEYKKTTIRQAGAKFSGDSAHTEGEPSASSRRNSSSSYQRSDLSCLSSHTHGADGSPRGEDKLRPGRTSVSQRISNDTAKERNSGQASEGPESFENFTEEHRQAPRSYTSLEDNSSVVSSCIRDVSGSATDTSAMTDTSGDTRSTFTPNSFKKVSANQEGRNSQNSGSGARSRRSSFALERASFESNGAYLEAFHRQQNQAEAPLPANSIQDPAALCEALRIPPNMQKRFLALGIVPSDTPLPMSMLRRLWGLASDSDAEATANLLNELGVMKVACLTDNTAWALVHPGHRKALQDVLGDSGAALHSKLLAAYLQPGCDSLADVPDDGYIMQNAGHHIVHTEALDNLRLLLMRPAWLECKLHSYGVGSVVADFRRYLMVESDDGIKLLLEAFQMSVSACLAHPTVAMLHQQLQGRLQLVRRSSQVKLDGRPLQTADTGSLAKAASLRTLTASLEQAGGLQRMTLRGHTGGVQKVLLTPGGIDIITSSTDGTSRVWDMEIGDCVLLLEGHTAPLTDMVTATDGSVVVTASEDGTARVWDLEEGNCLCILEGHSGAVNSVAVDRHGKIAVTAGEDGTGRLWDLATGACLQLLLGHTSLGALHKVILTGDGSRAITCSSDFTARVWEIYSGTCVQTFSGHTGWVVGCALTSDSSLLVTSSHDGTARVWNMLSGRLVHVLGGHAGRINAVRISPNNRTVMTVADDYTARVYDLQSGKCRHKLEGHGGWVSDVAIHPANDSAITVAGDDLAVVWDLLTGSCKNVLEGHSGEVLSVVMTRQGRFAVTGSTDGTARIWDLAAGSAHLQRSHTGRVHGLAATPDNSHVISFGNDGCLVWGTEEKACTALLEGPAVRWAACLQDNNTLLCASGDRTTKVWQLDSCDGRIALQGNRGSRVKSWDASQDGRMAVVVLFDSTVTVWDLHRQEPAVVLQQWGRRDEASGHTGGVNAGYITHDGKQVLTVSKDCTARIWDVAKGTTVRVLKGHTDGVTGACFSKDSQRAVTMSYDSTARLWDMRDGTCLGAMRHGGAVTRAQFSRDGRLIITASADNTATLWRCNQSGKPVPVHSLKGHKEELMGVAISGDNRWAATCSRDNCLRLWNCATGAVDGVFVADASLTCCVFAGDVLFAGDDSGILHLLELPKPRS